MTVQTNCNFLATRHPAVAGRLTSKGSFVVALLAAACLPAGALLAQQKGAKPKGAPAATVQEKPAAAQNPMEAFPKVVAVVNGQTISRDQLGNACLRRYGSVVLDNLLNKHLILQACAAKGIQITQADVNDEITRVSQKFGLTTTLFLQALED